MTLHIPLIAFQDKENLTRIVLVGKKKGHKQNNTTQMKPPKHVLEERRQANVGFLNENKN